MTWSRGGGGVRCCPGGVLSRGGGGRCCDLVPGGGGGVVDLWCYPSPPGVEVTHAFENVNFARFATRAVIINIMEGSYEVLKIWVATKNSPLTPRFGIPSIQLKFIFPTKFKALLCSA